MTLTLRSAGFLGILVFGLAFALTFLSPIHYEKAARGFLEAKIEEQVRDTLEILPEGAREGRIARFAQTLAERHETEIIELKERLVSGINAQVAAVVARMQDLNCECRQLMTQALNIATSLRIASLERAEPQLRRFIEGRYVEIVDDLLHDLRIFTGTNLAAFGLLLGLSFAKPAHVRQLFVPGILLAVAAIVASSIYIFGQNWFFTLLYSDYMGAAYAIWLALIYGFLADIALFQARITTAIVDAIMSAFTSVFSAGPC